MTSDYLHPPAMPTVAIIVDGGGFVEEYKKQTELYRQTGQTLKLLNCRSACTMALSLPNACVYPRSVLKFHSAYNWITKAVSPKETAEIFSMYPLAVQQKLGYLEPEYKVLDGNELIKLGVKQCK